MVVFIIKLNSLANECCYNNILWHMIGLILLIIGIVIFEINVKTNEKPN
jgi:hypothetical protein